MIAYLLGVATPFTAGALLLLAIRAQALLTELLWTRYGITVEAKKRNLERLDDYVLRHNIWWERQFGPVFIGGWYREDNRRRINRWIGLGSPNGLCVIFYRTWDLGEAGSR